MKQYLGWSFLLLFFLSLGACKTKTIVQKQMWYTITLPKKWKVVSPTKLQSPHAEPTIVTIVRRRDDGSLESYAKAQRDSLKIEIPDFQEEDSKFFTLNGRKAWKLIGIFAPKGPGTPKFVRIKLYVSSPKYLYDLTIMMPAGAYRTRIKKLNKILNTFRFTIPAY